MSYFTLWPKHKFLVLTNQKETIYIVDLIISFNKYWNPAYNGRVCMCVNMREIDRKKLRTEILEVA